MMIKNLLTLFIVIFYKSNSQNIDNMFEKHKNGILALKNLEKEINEDEDLVEILNESKKTIEDIIIQYNWQNVLSNNVKALMIIVVYENNKNNPNEVISITKLINEKEKR